MRDATAVGSPASVPELQQRLRNHGYLAGRGLATATFIGLRLGQPILLEGEVGVGKTELAKCLAAIHGRELIRLQCYEGIDTHQAPLRMGLRPSDTPRPGTLGTRAC